MKVFGWVILTIVGIVLLIGGGWAFKYYTASTKGKIDAQVEIESGKNRIVKYNRFYDLYATIQADYDSLQTQKELLKQLEEDTEPDKGEIARVRTNVAALKAQVRRDIREYNVDMRKTYTNARFAPDDLPRELSIEKLKYQ